LARRELPRLSKIHGGFNYRIPLPGAVLRDGKLHANIELPGLEIRYTTDGSEPTTYSLLYSKPTAVSGTIIKLRAFDRAGKGSRTAVLK